MNQEEVLPLLRLSGSWKELPDPGNASELASVLAMYMPRCRWFGAKAREVVSSAIESVVPIDGPVEKAGSGVSFLCVLSVSYRSGEPDRYLFPLARAVAGQTESKARIARLEMSGEDTIGMELVDGLYLPEMGRALLDLFGDKESGKSDKSNPIGVLTTEDFDSLRQRCPPDESPVLFRGEQSNSSLMFGGALIMKCFRRLEPGINPDLEVGMFMEGLSGSRLIPPLGGALLGSTPAGEPLTFAILQGFVPNRGDGWSWMRDMLKQGVLDSEHGESVASGPFGEKLSRMVIRLGTRTAFLHRALARDPDDPDFAPEPITEEDIEESIRSVGLRLEKTFDLLAVNLGRLTEDSRTEGESLLESVSEVRSLIRLQGRIVGRGFKIRCHGDFHLGQTLITPEEEVVFLDFEGEPSLEIRERRQKRSPLLDVAGMLRSLHYVSRSVLQDSLHPTAVLKSHRWFVEASESYLSSYLRGMESGQYLLPDRELLFPLLTLYLLRKALYELEYELNNRPDWVAIPLAGIRTLLEER
ncbi:MAG: maltokinase N-terminal cap-like domain-containing protein [Leptospirales bacterium]